LEAALDEPEQTTPPPEPPDRSLRLMLTWVAVALVAAVIFAFIGVEVVFWLFDR
jgi:hypothetical protein